MNLALFDLDHTLLQIDSDYAWGVYTTRIGWTDPEAFARRNDEFYAHYKAGTLDIHDYVRFATDAVRQRGPQAAAEAHAVFMREVVEPALLPAARALVEEHRARGDTLLLVTATNEFVTRPIADAVPELVEMALRKAGAKSDNVTVLSVEWESSEDYDSTKAISTQSLGEEVFASTIQASVLGQEPDDLDEAEIERSIREINEAIRRSSQKKG